MIGFTVGEDALGLIDLGVDHDNFDDRVTQTVNAGNLEIYLDRDGIGTQHGEVLLATLTGITETLDMEEDFLLANPSGAAQAEIIIDGTAGADMLLGSTGNDMIFALAGDDVVLGLAGDDQIDGGEGSDTASYAQAEGDVSVYLEWTGLDVGGGEGADSLISIENLTGSDFDDRLVGDSESNVLTGGAGNDRLIGKGGDDILLGEAGIDALIGETGSDELDGGADRDYLYGNLGEDRLYGGAGDDNLHGGSGAGLLDGASDVFIYRGTADGGGGYDRILDFENGLDQIDLSAFGFTDFTNDVAALASEMDAGLKIKFAPGDVLFIENFALADFDATDVLLA